MTSPKLFLEWNDHDGQYHVNDADGFAFGGGSFEPTDAIKHARVVSDAPIYIGETQSGIPEQVVSETPLGTIADAEQFISALAEIGGMKVTKLYDDNMHFIGYTMEVQK